MKNQNYLETVEPELANIYDGEAHICANEEKTFCVACFDKELSTATTISHEGNLLPIEIIMQYLTFDDISTIIKNQLPLWLEEKGQFLQCPGCNEINDAEFSVDKQFKCSYCSKSFCYKIDNYVHLSHEGKTCHKELQEFRDDILLKKTVGCCGKVVALMMYVQKHECSYGKYVCWTCDQVFSDGNQYVLHRNAVPVGMKIHHTSKKVK